VDALALLKWDFEADQLDLRGLVERALQVHLYARTIRIPQCNVAEEIEIEVAAEFAIDARQDILLKRRDALGVVVGGEEGRCIFTRSVPRSR